MSTKRRILALAFSLGALGLLTWSVSITPVEAQSGTSIQVDAAASRRPIDPRVYGVNWADSAQLAALNVSTHRWGGNSTTRHNWKTNGDNRGSDWYFESIPGSGAQGAAFDDFVQLSLANGAAPMVTVPIIGWVGKNGPGGTKLASFSAAKYGAQQDCDWSWFPDACNGVRTNGTLVTGNDPNDANVQVNPQYQKEWAQHLVSRWGAAASGGVRYYIYDNEPSLWHHTHRDVHPNGQTMTELRDLMIAYGTAIKQADPGAVLVGPEEWGWSGYFYSGYDQKYGNDTGCWSCAPDKTANGGMDYMPWLLAQMRQHEQTSGNRLLHVFTLHYYPQGGEFGDDTSTAMQQRRNRSTRSLWDPNYTDETWIGDKVRLIPRMQEWVGAQYPGLETGITEYSWGADGHINGATAHADVLGIFGREGLSLGTRWVVPGASTPTFKAIQMYRNYDGNKSVFGDTSVKATVPNPDNLSAFAAERASDGALTIMVINKVTTSALVNLSLANFTPGSVAQHWRLTSSNAIQRQADVTVSAGAISATLAAQSINLFVVPRGGSPTTYTLTASKAGTGTGTVTSTPAGISCGADCSEPYSSGTVVALSAAAATGSTFSGWSGACTGTGACQVTMDAARSVTATFTLNAYSLTVAKAGTGSGTVTSTPAGINCGADCSEPYSSGAVVALSAAAATGSTFSGWSGACTGTGACQVTMDAARSVTATFTLNAYSLTVAKAGTGAGTVTSTPAGISCGADCSEPYNFGTVVALTPTATSGSTFSGWSGACTGTGACQVTMDAAKSVTATFTLTPVTHVLTVAKAGTGSGTVTSTPAGINCGADCSEPYSSGAVVALSAAAATGSTFSGWSGACTGTGACQVTMDAAKSVTATFTLTPVTYTLNVAKAGDGDGTVTSTPAGITCGADCSEVYNSGTIVTLTPMPVSGSVFVGWGGVCAGNGACQVSMTAARSVTATFGLGMYTLNVTKAGTGSGTVTSSPAGISCGADCSEPYNRGTVVSLTATPATGSLFAGWSGACSGTIGCQTTMDAARSVTASFSTASGPPPPGDFNRDGSPDLLWHKQASGLLYVWLLVNSKTVGGSYLTPDRFADTRWQVRGVVDFNNDGQTDILWHHQTTGDLYVWLMNGMTAVSGTYLTPSRFADTNWQIRGLAHFNADGKIDILWHHQKTGDLYVWFMSGATAISGSYLTPSRFADTNWQIRGLADFNGDGKTDVLWHHQKAGDLYVWLMNGTTAAGGSYLTPPRFADTRWQIVSVADFNGDGQSDVLWHHQQTGDLYVWYLNGAVTVSGGYLTPSRFADTTWKVAP